MRSFCGQQSQVAEVDDCHLPAGGEPSLSYEEVNTSLIPPRPRLYGLAGGDVIEQVWKERRSGEEVEPMTMTKNGKCQ